MIDEIEEPQEYIPTDDNLIRGYLVGVKGPHDYPAEDLQGILTAYLSEQGALEVEVVSLGPIETYEDQTDNAVKES